MIADAAQIADKHPFAVIEGNPAAAMPTVLARELGALGVLCLCTTSLTTSFYQDNPNVMSTGLPTGTDYCNFAAEYIGKRLAGKNAIYAGDELNPLQGFQKKPRVFGLLYVNGAGRARSRAREDQDRLRRGLRAVRHQLRRPRQLHLRPRQEPVRGQQHDLPAEGGGRDDGRADRRPAVADPHHAGGDAELLPRVVRHRHRPVRHDDRGTPCTTRTSGATRSA